MTVTDGKSSRPIPKPDFGRPHVVLLGAGASLAAFPHGDRWGKRLPLMNNLIEVLGLGPSLSGAGIAHTGVNFEALYSELVSSGKHTEVVRLIEAAVFSYFHGMRLPDRPTIYDHLVLGLRPKDFIATFNWDPYLEQAIQRNYIDRRVPPPRIAHLHGCVSLSYCDRHAPITFQRSDTPCLKCGEDTTPTRLIYPVTQKDYNADPHTKAAWHDTQLVLREAYLFTVYGYSAPTTDVEAVRLLEDAWGSPARRRLEQVEVVDIKTTANLWKTWKRFVHNEHWSPMDDLRCSLLWRYPRRSCESFWNMTMQCSPGPERSPPEDVDLQALWEWHRPAIEQELEHDRESAATEVARPRLPSTAN